MPLMTLSQSMGESCRELDNESSIRKMLEVCCYIEGTLAKVCVDHELQLEKDVLDPLFKLSEEELPNILKHKKKLDKLTLDWTSAKNRLGQATKSVNTGAMAQPTTAKVDLLKDEVDEIWRKVELSKDEYAADLYHFASKEEEYSNYFYLLLEAQAEYHRRSLNALDALLPTLKTSPNSPAVIPENPAYGRPLKEHLENRGQDIALPIEACVMMLLEKGMKEEGLFRLAAAASVLKRLKAALDGGSFDPEEFNSDSHAVAGALKSYLRELPQPLMTFDLYDEWFQAASEKDLPKQIERLREVSAKLPEEFYKNFRYLIKFLAKLAEYHAVNKMTPTNIAIVLGPNLLWPRNEGTVSMMNMASASSVQVVLVIEPVIQNADGIFPEDLDFSVSGMFGPSSLYSSYTSTKKDIGSTEPAQTTPPPLKEVTALKEEGLCEDRTLVRPSSPPPDVEEGPSKVEAPPNQTAPNQADPTSQTPNNLTKKVKKPVPLRPTFPPPHHPKASLPWTSKPMCASLTQPIDERPIVRRATACPVRVPAVPPPPVPAPRTHQRTTSLGSAHFRLGDPPEAGGDSGKGPPEASVKTAPCQPRSPQVSWDTESQPQSKPQATARVRVLSANQAMLAGTNPKVKGSLSVERSGPQEQSPDATTGGHL